MLPDDVSRAVMVGRVWRSGVINGPCVVAVRNGEVFDITAHAPTMSDLLERDDALEVARSAPGQSLGPVQALLVNAIGGAADDAIPRLLAPCDLQAIKACGVTFAVSLLERVIEEQAAGDPSRANALRAEIQTIIGSDLSAIRPGSPEAAKLKADLIARDLWSPSATARSSTSPATPPPCPNCWSATMSSTSPAAHPANRWAACGN